MVSVLALPGLKIDRAKLLEVARHFSKHEGCCLLYSGASGGSTEVGLRSYLGLFPYEIARHRIGQGQDSWQLLKSNLALPEEAHPFPD